MTASDAAPSRPGTESPSRQWQGLSLIAALASFGWMTQQYLRISEHSAGAAVFGSLSYLALLVAAALAIAARTELLLRVADTITLSALVLFQLLEVQLAAWRRTPGAVDEGRLTEAAIRVLAQGHNPYVPSFAADLTRSKTFLMNGGTAVHFDYPPLSAILGAVGSYLWAGFAHIDVLTLLALLAAAIVAFVVTAPRFRAAVVLATLGLGLLLPRAATGEPIVIALPFLMLATLRWHRIGERRVRVDAAAGGCFGLAMADQQLVWFLLPFLLVAVWCLHRDDWGGGGAVRRLLPYVGSALGVFALVNLPFVVADPGAWWRGVTGVTWQHAVPDGPGPARLSLDLTSGTGAFGAYRVGAALLLIALLALLAIAPRRLSPAFATLPMLAFFCSPRSEVGYYVAFAPLWVLLVMTTPPGMVTAAHGVLSGVSSRWRVGVAAALFVPALVSFDVAAGSPAPFLMRVTALETRAGHAFLTVIVHNRDDQALSPHFIVGVRDRMGAFWTRLSGPSLIEPAQTTRYRLRSPRPFHASSGRARLLVTTDSPETITAKEFHTG